MTNKSGVLQDWLLLRMRYEGWPGTPQLPPVRELAAQWRLPARTVMDALHGLAQRGVLRRNASRRYEVRETSALESSAKGHSSSLPSEKVGTNASWQRTYSRLREDLASGLPDPEGRLPPRKRLEANYLCNARTLQRALERLADDGLLTRVARGYRYHTTSSAGRKRRGCIYLTGYAASMRSFLSQHHAFVRAAETEAQRLGSDFRLFMSDRPCEDPKAPGNENVTGFINLATERPERGFEWMRYFEINRSAPLVIFDPPERSKRYRRHTGLCKLLPDSRRAGHEIAGQLVAEGHQRAAFFAPFALERGWASLRLAGFSEVMSGAGIHTDIHVTDSRQPTPVQRQLSGVVNHHVGLLQKELTMSGRLEKETVGDVFRNAYSLLSTVQAWASLENAFTLALRQNSTAWVCLHDGVAAVAWSFLKRHGALASVHLVGFDNSPLAYSLQFSSYDFRYDTLGRWAVQWLTAPGKAYLLQRMPGQLLVRGDWQATRASMSRQR